MSTQISDERLAELIADYEQHAGWEEDPVDKAYSEIVVTALRELQQRRRNELQLIADINAMGSDDD